MQKIQVLRYLVFFAIVLMLMFSVSCRHKSDVDDDGGDAVILPDDTTTLISTFNSTLSHRQGENCMKCHQKGGNGKAWFTIAGTVYDSTLQKVYPNALVRIYEGIDTNSTFVARVEVDSLGNFYTTEKVDFSKGHHVEVIGQRIRAGMGSLIRSGECSRCHGVQTNRVWTK